MRTDPNIAQVILFYAGNSLSLKQRLNHLLLAWTGKITPDTTETNIMKTTQIQIFISAGKTHNISFDTIICSVEVWLRYPTGNGMENFVAYNDETIFYR